jgi:protein gp37
MRFLSIEPLIGPVGTLVLQGIHWVIVGGESGPGARPMQPEWVVDIRNQCLSADVAFFFTDSPGLSGKILDL